MTYCYTHNDNATQQHQGRIFLSQRKTNTDNHNEQCAESGSPRKKALGKGGEFE